MAEYRRKKADWQTLGKNDWGDIVALSAKKTYQRKFQIVEAFTKLVAKKGIHNLTHHDLAKECGVTRQLVDHHFSSDRELLFLTYKYIYARFQKVGSDSVVTHEGTLNQFRAYLYSVANWATDYRSDACFLTQHLALASLYPEILEHHERNMKMGRDRIRSMLANFQDEGLLKKIPIERLNDYALAIQTQIAGHLVLTTALPKNRIKFKESADSLVKSCFALLGLGVE